MHKCTQLRQILLELILPSLEAPAYDHPRSPRVSKLTLLVPESLQIISSIALLILLHRPQGFANRGHPPLPLSPSALPASRDAACLAQAAPSPGKHDLCWPRPNALQPTPPHVPEKPAAMHTQILETSPSHWNMNAYFASGVPMQFGNWARMLYFLCF